MGHMTGRRFRDYHLLLDGLAEHVFAVTDDIAERARKIGRSTLRSISNISRHQRLKENNEELSLIEVWIYQTDRRTWFLWEIVHSL